MESTSGRARGRVWRSTIGAVGLIAVATLVPAGSAAAHEKHHHDSDGTGFSVVATGLDNPRGLAIRSNGQLVVGEAGHAGTDGCFAGNPEDPEGQTCIGFTSQISTINVRTGTHRPIVTGLVSIGDGPIATTGVDGVATQGNKVYGIMTAAPQGAPPAEACGDQPGCPEALDAAKAQFGKLIRARRHHSWSAVADVGSYNYDYIVDNKATLDPDNPDFQPGDANPYGLAAGHRDMYVVDGGSNTLDRVTRSGRIEVLAYIPNPPGEPGERFPYDSVPTCVAKTEHGVVVGDLAGRLWNWSHGNLTQIEVPADMLHSINGCAVDEDDNIYAVDMFSGFSEQGFLPNTGSVVQVTDDGVASVIATGLNLPGGIAIGRHGKIYVSNNAVCPADVAGLPPDLCPSSGEVVRLDHRAEEHDDD